MTHSEHSQSNIQDFEFGVIGLGQTGNSVARFLKGLKHSFCAMDTREDAPQLEMFRAQFPQTEIHAGELPATQLERCHELVVSPGIDPQLPELEKACASGSKIIGDIELFCRAAEAPILAITGTNGKSTVTTMVAHVLQSAGRQVLSGGNLGPPALELLDGAVPEFYVLELSSFQLDTTDSLKPKVGVVLNISADHLDRHQSIDAYADVKSKVLSGAETCVVNADDARVVEMNCSGARRTFSADPDSTADYKAFLDGEQITLCFPDGTKEHIASLAAAGGHNIENAAAVAAICSAVDVTSKEIAAALETYELLPHRARVVGECNGVRYINDSKATNPGAASASLRGISSASGIVVILGGSSKQASFKDLADDLAALAHHAVLIGETGREIEREISGRIACVYASSMNAAVRQAADLANPGDVVLLAPACASFDMFENYAARGEAFEVAVGLLGDDAWQA